MSIGIYPGSFNPWHRGHEDILEKAVKVFDKVIIATGYNPDKPDVPHEISEEIETKLKKEFKGKVNFISFPRSLMEIAEQVEATAVIRGLRNGNDLQYEMNQQYWNEDVGMEIPFVYFIADRTLGHVSSSAIRAVDKLGLEHRYS